MRRSSVAVLVGSLLAVGAPVGWQLSHPASHEFGASRAAELGSAPAARAPAPAAAEPAATAPAAGSAPTTGGAPAARSARLADAPRATIDPPVRLTLPGLEVAVRPVGLDARGGMEIPEDVDEVGWYRYGSAPGDPAGATVLVGHIDDADQGLGAFARLRELQPGAALEVRTGSGGSRRYQVVAREQWRKDAAPLDRLFDGAGAARLVLLSCAGTFDRRTRSYSDNVAVTAVPAP